jgi:hypothetical protein
MKDQVFRSMLIVLMVITMGVLAWVGVLPAEGFAVPAFLRFLLNVSLLCALAVFPAGVMAYVIDLIYTKVKNKD